MKPNILINLKTSKESQTLNKFITKIILSSNYYKACYENGNFYQLSGTIIDKSFIRSYWFLKDGEPTSKEIIVDEFNKCEDKKYILIGKI